MTRYSGIELCPAMRWGLKCYRVCSDTLGWADSGRAVRGEGGGDFQRRKWQIGITFWYFEFY